MSASGSNDDPRCGRPRGGAREGILNFEVIGVYGILQKTNVCDDPVSGGSGTTADGRRR